MDFRHELVLPDEDLPFKLFVFEGKDGSYQVSRHWHRSVEIFLVLEGSLDFYINTQRYRMVPMRFTALTVPMRIIRLSCRFQEGCLRNTCLMQTAWHSASSYGSPGRAARRAAGS